MTDLISREEAIARILAPHLPGGREFDDMPKNRVQYREWAAIGKCEYNDATQEEAFDAADAAIATMFERLRDPATVHVNMLRGGIAKPSPTNIWHIYGRELLADMPKEYAAEEKAKLFERLRTPSEGMIWQRAYRDMTDVELRDIVAASANGQLSRSLFAPATAELQRRAKTPVTPPTSQKPER